jgi:hypothetical protein
MTSLSQTSRIAEATKYLNAAEVASRKQKTVKITGNGRFPPGTDMEILNADCVVLIGISHALRCVLYINRSQ